MTKYIKKIINTVHNHNSLLTLPHAQRIGRRHLRGQERHGAEMPLLAVGQIDHLAVAEEDDDVIARLPVGVGRVAGAEDVGRGVGDGGEVAKSELGLGGGCACVLWVRIRKAITV